MIDNQNLESKIFIFLTGAVSISRVGKTMVGRIENKKIEFFYDGLNYFKLTVPLDYVSVGILMEFLVDHHALYLGSSNSSHEWTCR